MTKFTAIQPKDWDLEEAEKVLRNSPFEFLETSPLEQGLIRIGAVSVVAKTTRVSQRIVARSVIVGH